MSEFDFLLAKILNLVKTVTIASVISLVMIGAGLFWEALKLYKKKKS